MILVYSNHIQMNIIIYSCILTLASSLNINRQLPPINHHIQPNLQSNTTIFIHQPFQYTLHPLANIQSPIPSCIFKKSNLEINNIFQIKQPSPSHIQFIFSGKYQIIYVLNNLQLTAYKYLPQKHHLQFLSTYQFQRECRESASLDIQQQYLYLFSCQEVLRVKIKTVLAEITTLFQVDQPFNGFKVYRFEDIFIWVSPRSINIYGKLVNHNLTFLQSISTYGGQSIQIADVSYNHQKGHLFILNHTHSIFILSRNSNNTFKQWDSITLPNTSINLYLQLHHHSIFVGSSYGTHFAVIQLLYYRQKVDLVRYYKNYKQIMEMQIIEGKLMIVTDSKIDIYPINVDPRQIEVPMNGVTNGNLRNIVGITNLNFKYYIIATLDSIEIVSLTLHSPTLNCKFESEGVREIKVPIECQWVLYHKDVFYDSCQKYQIINITAIQPHYSTTKLIISILLAFLLFALVIIALIHWRNNQMQIIDRLVKEIRKIRLRHKERVEFVEERNEPAKQRNWNYDMGTQAYQLDKNEMQMHRDDQQKD